MEAIVSSAILIGVIFIPLVVLFLLRKKRVVIAIVSLLVLVLGIMLQARGSGGNLRSICDALSFVGILLVAMPLLFASGRADDFLLAFRVCLFGYDADVKSLKKALLAVRLAEKLVATGGIITFMVGSLSILNYLEDLSAIRPNLVIALLPLLYALLLRALLKSVSACVEAKIVELE